MWRGVGAWLEMSTIFSRTGEFHGAIDTDLGAPSSNIL